MSDYKLIDAGAFYKLEQVGPYRLMRPSPQAVWPRQLPDKDWQKIDAKFTRFSGGDGKWDIYNKKIPEYWNVKIGAVTFRAGLTDFGHIGIFPEQEDNWA